VLNTVNNQRITDLFIAANRDSRMGDAYLAYLASWRSAGGGLFMNYTSVGAASKWGCWGLMESMVSTNRPRYDALIQYLNSGP
jgi:hypothetical protein